MKVSKLKYLLFRKNLNYIIKIKKNDFVQIKFLNIFLKNLRTKVVSGFCKKKSQYRSVILNTKAKKEKVEQIFFLNSPLLLNISTGADLIIEKK